MPLKKNVILFIVGPTAIGKTSVALKVARRIGGEIISADSMQVYKGMDILSQAPRRSETKKVRHHLVRFVGAQNKFSAASFVKKSSALIKDITRRKRTPIVAGGSGLYVRALIDGLFPSPKANLLYRKKLYDYAARYGSARLHKKLKAIDPVAAGSIHPNDTRRIARALELYHSTGKTMTELKGLTKGIADKYDIKIFGLTAARETIYSKTDDRVETMFASGVVREVERLSGKRLSVTARAALGIKEISGYLKGEYSLDEAKELMKRNTRRLAKGQLTWFRADKRIKWLDTGRLSEGEIVKRITEGRWSAR